MANILTAIPELLGKLATEHVSAEVQGKHIALLKEQFGILDREKTQLASENSVLKAEIQGLQSEKEHLIKDNEILRGKILEYEQSPQNSLTSLNIEEFTIHPEGFYKHPKYEHAICPKCLHHEKPKVVPMTQASGPWQCVSCDYKISPKAACVGISTPIRRGGFVKNY